MSYTHLDVVLEQSYVEALHAGETRVAAVRDGGGAQAKGVSHPSEAVREPIDDLVCDRTKNKSSKDIYNDNMHVMVII